MRSSRKYTYYSHKGDFSPSPASPNGNSKLYYPSPVPFVVAYIKDRKNFWLSLSLNSTEIFVLSPHMCIRIWVQAMIGLLQCDYYTVYLGPPRPRWPGK